MTKKKKAAAEPEVEQFTKDAQAELGDPRSRRGRELEMWHHWNNNGRQPEHLEPLMTSVEPMIRREATKRIAGLGGTMPRAALTQELRNAAFRAFETYDPAKNTQLSTHLTINFHRVTDPVNAIRNPKSISRDVADQYGPYASVVHEHVEKFGRPPTTAEVKQALPHYKEETIRKLRKSFGAEVFTDMGDDFDAGGPPIDIAEKIRNAVALMRPTFTPDEITFAELHYLGARQKTPEQIAREMRIPVVKVYKIKGAVEKKIEHVVKSQ